VIADLIRRAGNKLYGPAFPIYRPLYRAFKAYTDRHKRSFLAGRLARGQVVVDAGANIGIYSRFLAKCVAPSGVVHSFEPDPTNFLRLQQSLSHTPNVKLNQLAVSDITGASVLHVSASLNVDHRLYPTEDENRTALPIRSIRLDDYFDPGAQVDFVKLDIQGYEWHALRGAERVLRDNPHVELMFECWPSGLLQAGASASALLRFLRERDFEVYEVRENKLKLNSAEKLEERPSYFDLFASRGRSQSS
jgi:FkbM family methyltransferase